MVISSTSKFNIKSILHYICTLY